jgi:hypothetical protein
MPGRSEQITSQKVIAHGTIFKKTGDTMRNKTGLSMLSAPETRMTGARSSWLKARVFHSDRVRMEIRTGRSCAFQATRRYGPGRPSTGIRSDGLAIRR